MCGSPAPALARPRSLRRGRARRGAGQARGNERARDSLHTAPPPTAPEPARGRAGGGAGRREPPGETQRQHDGHRPHNYISTCVMLHRLFLPARHRACEGAGGQKKLFNIISSTNMIMFATESQTSTPTSRPPPRSPSNRGTAQPTSPPPGGWAGAAAAVDQPSNRGTAQPTLPPPRVGGWGRRRQPLLLGYRSANSAFAEGVKKKPGHCRGCRVYYRNTLR